MVSYGYSYAAGLLVGAAAVTYLVGWPWAVPFYIFAAFWNAAIRNAMPPGPSRSPGRR
jgi:hypothetical protein